MTEWIFYHPIAFTVIIIFTLGFIHDMSQHWASAFSKKWSKEGDDNS
jgi:hypothetical protein